MDWYPYPDGLLLEKDVFDLLVLDGGGFFVTQGMLGGVSNEVFMDFLEEETLPAPWWRGEDVDWMAAYDPRRSPWAPGQTMEKHVWLMRLYFLLPLAQEAARRKDGRLVEKWGRMFSAWRSAFPVPSPMSMARAMKATAMVWYDMQVSWRLLVFVHGLRLLALAGVPSSLRRQVEDAVAEHATWLVREVNETVSRRGEGEAMGNHFLQKGTALLYAGTLLKGHRESAVWLERGRMAVLLHAKRDILSDGGSIEGSPSYSHFIARLHLEAYRLMMHHRMEDTASLGECIEREYRFLSMTASPAGTALQLSDSYPLDVSNDLEVASMSAGDLEVPSLRVPSWAIFPESRFLVCRRGNLTLYVDGMREGKWHVHRGKPNFLLFAGVHPVVVDSGCTDYDLQDLRKYLVDAQAHNTVVCDEVDCSRRECSFSTEGSRLVVGVRGDGHEGVRKFLLSEDVLEVEDVHRHDGAAAMVLHLHLGGAEYVSSPGLRVPTAGGTCAVDVENARTGRILPVECSLKPAVDEHLRVVSRVDVSVPSPGKEAAVRTRIRLETYR